MDTYVCHKKVKAAKVVGEYERITGSGLTHIEGVWIKGSTEYAAELKFFPPEHVARLISSRQTGGFVGGYWVEYEDGYVSWSPAKAFEDGYTKV